MNKSFEQWGNVILENMSQIELTHYIADMFADWKNERSEYFNGRIRIKVSELKNGDYFTDPDLSCGGLCQFLSRGKNDRIIAWPLANHSSYGFTDYPQMYIDNPDKEVTLLPFIRQIMEHINYI
jgi:hypothetical protein